MEHSLPRRCVIVDANVETADSPILLIDSCPCYGQAQVIVAASLTQAANDKQQLVPVLEEVKTNVGRLPEKVTADSGYFSAAAVTSEEISSVDLT